MASPCLSCGACCAAFRVSFTWWEADARLPDELLERVTPFRMAMRRTEDEPRRCVALAGTIGCHGVGCTVYDLRPQPCRDFQASYADGTPQHDCDRARASFGLPPLTPESWTQSVA